MDGFRICGGTIYLRRAASKGVMKPSPLAEVSIVSGEQRGGFGLDGLVPGRRGVAELQGG